MIKQQETCGTCGGTGKTVITVVDSFKFIDSSSGRIGSAHNEERICLQCNGKGYTEYAKFTIEEAEVILKHCGLSTES